MQTLNFQLKKIKKCCHKNYEIELEHECAMQNFIGFAVTKR